MGKEDRREKVQRYLVAAGLLVGCYLAWCLIRYPVQTNITGHHIDYTLKFPPVLRNYSIVLYALATIIPLFISLTKGMWIVGVAIAISYIISAIFYEHYILSVWCFFASIISISVYVVLNESNKDSCKVQSE